MWFRDKITSSKLLYIFKFTLKNHWVQLESQSDSVVITGCYKTLEFCIFNIIFSIHFENYILHGRRVKKYPYHPLWYCHKLLTIAGTTLVSYRKKSLHEAFKALRLRERKRQMTDLKFVFRLWIPSDANELALKGLLRWTEYRLP